MTINCAERGLLLLRVRDEIQMTIAAYQTLYESSVAFGVRKALQAEQGKADMEKRVRTRNNIMCHTGAEGKFQLGDLTCCSSKNENVSQQFFS